MSPQDGAVLHDDDKYFWKYVEKMDGGRKRCRFCGDDFAKDNAITRFKFHFARVKGHGIRICGGNVSKDVQEAALAAIDCHAKKKLKTGEGSSNNEVTNAISASAQQQNNEMTIAQQQNNEISLEDRMASITVEDMEPLQTGSFHEWPSFNQANEPRGDPSQPTNDQLCSPSVNNDIIMNYAQQRETIFTREYEWENDFFGGIELGRYTPETNPITEQANPETDFARDHCSPEELPHGEFQTLPRTETLVQVLEQSNAERDNLFVNAGRTRVGFQGMEQGEEEGRVCLHLDMENTGEGSVQHVDRIVPPTIDENYNRGEATETLVHHGVGSSSFVVYGNHNAISSQQESMDHAPGSNVQEYMRIFKACLLEDSIDNGTGVVQPGAGASSSGGLTGNTNETPGDPLPTSSTKPVGRAFEQNTNEIWSWLMDDEVSTIGIYGMGGVGKTTMLKHIHNKLLGSRDICHSIYWVTMSRDFSIERLQKLIAKCIQLDLSSEDDDLRRAAKLSKELRKKQKWILILDDLWNTFELHEVGIPDPVKGFKLMMTTRSEKVCQRMHSQRKIKVKPLSVDEAWTLFMEKLGHDIPLPPEVEKIAVDIARECAGLPLGVITMAGSLMGVYDQHEWRNTLKKLKESKCRDMEDEVFRLLRFSYDRLDNDSALQQCLLYCALFPEDHCIEREELIDYLIDEGIIEEMGSRQAGFDEGHSMLNKLENVCLLETATDDDGCRCVKMHDLIRDMAIHILQKNSQNMVKAGARLRELPDEKEWTENFKRVSLMKNKITEIPSSHSPGCPTLSTLLFCGNPLVNIADSFFKRLHGLKVLDLSYTDIIKLPDSVSGLVSLTALVLQNCIMLRHVPSLEKLTVLKKLDLTRTALEKMPQGMECLRNLEYLRMNGCGEKEFPSGLLLKLSRLQVLVLEEELINGRYAPITIKGNEVGCLRKLESLKCHFEGHSDFAEYLKSRDETQSLSTYCIWVGHPTRSKDYDVRTSKTIAFINLSGEDLSGEDLSGEDFQVMFPKDIQQLIIDRCHDATSLCDVFSLINYATALEDIDIRHCNSMESLVSSSNICSALSLNGTFSCLKKLRCDNCVSMKRLFPLVLLQNLVNLEKITVSNCRNMEEIIGEGVTGEESSSNMEFKLSKLRELNLDSLPELKRISSAKVICDSLQKVRVHSCDSMEILFPSSWSLVNLENIRVSYCQKIEEIIGGARSDEEGVVGEESSTSTEIKLSKLTELTLIFLSELKRISSAKVICDSLQILRVENCDNMEILLPSSWSLVNLEYFKVLDCKKMEGIEGGTKELILPKLIFAFFRKLPEMKSICSAKLICNNLVYDSGEWVSRWERASEEERALEVERASEVESEEESEEESDL